MTADLRQQLAEALHKAGSEDPLCPMDMLADTALLTIADWIDLEDKRTEGEWIAVELREVASDE